MLWSIVDDDDDDTNIHLIQLNEKDWTKPNTRWEENRMKKKKRSIWIITQNRNLDENCGRKTIHISWRQLVNIFYFEILSVHFLFLFWAKHHFEEINNFNISVTSMIQHWIKMNIIWLYFSKLNFPILMITRSAINFNGYDIQKPKEK